MFLVSGWSGPGVEWKLSPIPARLRYAGFVVRRHHQPANGWGNISTNAAILAESIRKEKERGRQVFVIGHSMGGLVGRETDAWGWKNIDGLVTIGTPHRGTIVAHLGRLFSQSCRQMLPKSKFIANHSGWPTMYPQLNIACKFDLAVIPGINAVHPLADEVEWVNHGHLSVIYSKKVADRVVEFLTSVRA